MKHIALLALLLLAGCAPAERIEIGGLFALTGLGSQFGTDELRGAELAVSEINAQGGIDGRKIVLVPEDTRTEFVATLSAYRKLVDADGIQYLIGPTWGPYARTVIPSLQEDGVIAVSPSTGEEFDEYKDPNFFKAWGADRLEIPVLIRHMERFGTRRIAIVTSVGAFEETMKQNFLKEANLSEVDVIADYVVSPEEKDFKSLLQRIDSTDAEAVYIVLAGFDNAGLFFKQMREFGMEMPVYAWSGFENYGMLEKYAPYIENALYPVPVETERDRAFARKFAEHYGAEPLTPAAATSYDAVMLLRRALESVDDVGDIEAIKGALHDIEGYEGASPIVGFDEYGWAVTTREYKVRTVRDGAFVDA